MCEAATGLEKVSYAKHHWNTKKCTFKLSKMSYVLREVETSISRPRGLLPTTPRKVRRTDDAPAVPYAPEANHHAEDGAVQHLFFRCVASVEPTTHAEIESHFG